LTQDTTAYNALLFATARSKKPSAMAALTVLQTMESAGCAPDLVSYSLLMDVMVEVNNPELILEIIQHISSTSGTHLFQHRYLYLSIYIYIYMYIYIYL
jgi:hypothetical protein